MSFPGNAAPSGWSGWLDTAQLGSHTHSFRQEGRPARVLSALRAAGIRRVELWTGHAPPDQPAAWAEWKTLLDGEGVACDAIGIVPFSGADPERQAFDCARALGARVITADLRLSAMPAAAAAVDRWAQDSGIAVALHPHGAPHWLGNRAMLASILADRSPHMGVCLDTFWLLDSREPMTPFLAELGPRLLAAHLRDGISLPDRTLLEKPLGQGCADIAPLLDHLARVRFAGPVILETKDDATRAIPAALAALRAGPGAMRAPGRLSGAPPPTIGQAFQPGAG